MRRTRWALALPALLYLVVVLLIPLRTVVSYSIRERDVYGGVEPGYSREAWEQARAPYTRAIVVRTAFLAGGVTLACLLLGYPCALALARLSPGQRTIFVALLTFPLVTSSLLRVYGWMNLLPPAWRGNLWAVGLVETANYLPFMVLPLLRALERIDPNLGPAAMDLGASPWQSFWHVHWPLTRPGMLAGAVLVFIPVTGEFLAPKFVGEGRPETEVLGTLILKQFTEGRNWPYGAAASLWLLALVLPALLLALALRAQERSRP